jgi:hypothetical protein
VRRGFAPTLHKQIADLAYLGVGPALGEWRDSAPRDGGTGVAGFVRKQQRQSRVRRLARLLLLPQSEARRALSRSSRGSRAERGVVAPTVLRDCF